MAGSPEDISHKTIQSSPSPRAGTPHAWRAWKRIRRASALHGRFSIVSRASQTLLCSRDSDGVLCSERSWDRASGWYFTRRCVFVVVGRDKGYGALSVYPVFCLLMSSSQPLHDSDYEEEWTEADRWLMSRPDILAAIDADPSHLIEVPAGYHRTMGDQGTG